MSHFQVTLVYAMFPDHLEHCSHSKGLIWWLFCPWMSGWQSNVRGCLYEANGGMTRLPPSPGSPTVEGGLRCVCPCPDTLHTPDTVETMSCWHGLCLPHRLGFVSWGTFYLGCASQGHYCLKQEPTNCCFLGDLLVSVHSKGGGRVTLGFSGTWQSKLTQTSLVESRKKSQLRKWVIIDQKPCLQLSSEVVCSSKITYLDWYINVAVLWLPSDHLEATGLEDDVLCQWLYHLRHHASSHLSQAEL